MLVNHLVWLSPGTAPAGDPVLRAAVSAAEDGFWAPGGPAVPG